MSLYFYVCQVRSSSLLHVRIIIRRNNEQQSASATTKTAVINTGINIISLWFYSRFISLYKSSLWKSKNTVVRSILTGTDFVYTWNSIVLQQADGNLSWEVGRPEDSAFARVKGQTY